MWQPCCSFLSFPFALHLSVPSSPATLRVCYCEQIVPVCCSWSVHVRRWRASLTQNVGRWRFCCITSPWVELPKFLTPKSSGFLSFGGQVILDWNLRKRRQNLRKGWRGKWRASHHHRVWMTSALLALTALKTHFHSSPRRLMCLSLLWTGMQRSLMVLSQYIKKKQFRVNLIWATKKKKVDGERASIQQLPASPRSSRSALWESTSATNKVEMANYAEKFKNFARHAITHQRWRRSAK